MVSSCLVRRLMTSSPALPSGGRGAGSNPAGGTSADTPLTSTDTALDHGFPGRGRCPAVRPSPARSGPQRPSVPNWSPSFCGAAQCPTASESSQTVQGPLTVMQSRPHAATAAELLRRRRFHRLLQLAVDLRHGQHHEAGQPEHHRGRDTVTLRLGPPVIDGVRHLDREVPGLSYGPGSPLRRGAVTTLGCEEPESLPYPDDLDNHFVVDPAKFDFYAMDCYRVVGENDLASVYAQEVIRSSTDMDGSARKPMRIAEAKVTLGVVAARSGDLDTATALGTEALVGDRKSLPSLVLASRELVQVLKERYPDEPESAEYVER